MFLEREALEDVEFVGPGMEAASATYTDIDKPLPAAIKLDEWVAKAWTAQLLLRPLTDQYDVLSIDEALFYDLDIVQLARQLSSTESETTILPLPSIIGEDYESFFIHQKAAALFQAAREEFFEDGSDSDFSKGIISFIESYGSSAVSAIADLVLDLHTNDEIASEALRWIARINHPQSYGQRFWLLEKSLSSPSIKVRDGAVLGLASLDDPDVLPQLKAAIEQEAFAGLREDMEQLLVQLEEQQ